MCNSNYEPDISDMQFEIEQFIEQYDGTAIGYSVKNRYENCDGSVEAFKEIIEYMDTAR